MLTASATRTLWCNIVLMCIPVASELIDVLAEGEWERLEHGHSGSSWLFVKSTVSTPLSRELCCIGSKNKSGRMAVGNHPAHILAVDS